MHIHTAKQMNEILHGKKSTAIDQDVPTTQNIEDYTTTKTGINSDSIPSPLSFSADTSSSELASVTRDISKAAEESHILTPLCNSLSSHAPSELDMVPNSNNVCKERTKKNRVSHNPKKGVVDYSRFDKISLEGKYNIINSKMPI